MVSYCLVRNCRYRKTKEANPKDDEKVFLFNVPRAPEERRRTWLKNMGREEYLTRDKNMKLSCCSRHFEDKCFMNQKTKSSLVWSAVPTLFNFKPKRIHMNKREEEKGRLILLNMEGEVVQDEEEEKEEEEEEEQIRPAKRGRLPPNQEEEKAVRPTKKARTEFYPARTEFCPVVTEPISLAERRFQVLQDHAYEPPRSDFKNNYHRLLIDLCHQEDLKDRRSKLTRAKLKRLRDEIRHLKEKIAMYEKRQNLALEFIAELLSSASEGTPDPPAPASSSDPPEPTAAPPAPNQSQIPCNSRGTQVSERDLKLIRLGRPVERDDDAFDEPRWRKKKKKLTKKQLRAAARLKRAKANKLPKDKALNERLKNRLGCYLYLKLKDLAHNSKNRRSSNVKVAAVKAEVDSNAQPSSHSPPEEPKLRKLSQEEVAKLRLRLQPLPAVPRLDWVADSVEVSGPESGEGNQCVTEVSCSPVLDEAEQYETDLDRSQETIARAGEDCLEAEPIALLQDSRVEEEGYENKIPKIEDFLDMIDSAEGIEMD